MLRCGDWQVTCLSSPPAASLQSGPNSPSVMRSYQSRALAFKYWDSKRIRDQVASEYEPPSRRDEDIYLEEDTDGWVNDNYYNNAIEYDNQGIPYYGVYRNYNTLPQSRSFKGRKGRKFNWQSLVKLRPFRVRTSARAARRMTAGDTQYNSDTLGHFLMVSISPLHDNYIYHNECSDIVTYDCCNWDWNSFYCCGLTLHQRTK